MKQKTIHNVCYIILVIVLLVLFINSFLYTLPDILVRVAAIIALIDIAIITFILLVINRKNK